MYRLNGALIGVGVIDVLPSGVSSVYFFYDPDYSQLSLGKLSALKEIEYCRKRGLEYYYLGFYIHDSPKMKYKGEYQPAELLCPTTLQWFPFHSSVKFIEKNKFTPLDPVLAARRSDADADVIEKEFCCAHDPLTAILFIPLDFGTGRTVQFSDLTKRYQQILKPILQDFVTACGAGVSDHVILRFA